MTENKRFTITQDFEEHHRQIRDNGHIIMGCFVEPQAEVIVNLLNELSEENEQLKDALNQRTDQCDKYYKENEQLTQQLSDIKGQLVMLDNCDNWDYDRMKHTVREIAEIIGYNGTINPKR